MKFISIIFAKEIKNMVFKLEIWSSELLDKVQAFLHSDESKECDSLRMLILSSNFEFDVSYSSRMLNYYDEKGYIKAYRIRNGKRRFSISDVLALEFSLYLNQIGLSDDMIKQYNCLINKKQINGYSVFDLAIFYALTTIGLEDLWLYRSEENKQHLLTIKNREHRTYFSLSNEIRKLIKNPKDKVFENAKLFKFFPKFLLEIDKVRDKIGIPLLNKQFFNISKEMDIEKVINDFDIDDANVFQQLPLNVLNKNFKYYIKNKEGEFYGINVEGIGKREFIPNEYKDKVIKRVEDLNENIKILIKA
jgi:DNA-binding transcriptional MerR regulator